MFSRDDRTDWGYDNTNGKGYKTVADGGNYDNMTETMRNFYSVHPFYLGLEPDGKAHGVFIFNSNAQEVTLGPAPHMVYRTIGGQLELFYFPGPTPEEVIQQYQQVIGKPMVPPYWALDRGIPIDVMTLDIDYMDKYKDFTYDKKNWSGLPELAEKLHTLGLKLEIVLDPGIEPTTDGWKRAQSMDAGFIEWASQDLVPKQLQEQYPFAKNSKAMLYASWPDFHVAAPDFLDPSGKTAKWWASELERFHKSVAFDSIWLDLNEPSSFSTNVKIPWFWSSLNWHSKIKSLFCQLNQSKLEIPPYRTVSMFWWENEGRPGDSPATNFLSSKTLCMEGRTGKGKHTIYDTHNIYGLYETMASSEAIKRATGKRGLVVARQRPGMTTVESRKNEFQLVIAPDTIKLDDREINEKLELDRGNNILNITSTQLIDLNKSGPVWMLTWNNL
uniref:Glycoside hydrolase family 31 TIM barrel domain-containing protein n=1 Tax=Acrobeloides nanus TaxID=290746 RepID=A0A914CJR4_9BILA